MNRREFLSLAGSTLAFTAVVGLAPNNKPPARQDEQVRGADWKGHAALAMFTPYEDDTNIVMVNGVCYAAYPIDLLATAETPAHSARFMPDHVSRFPPVEPGVVYIPLPYSDGIPPQDAIALLRHAADSPGKKTGRGCVLGLGDEHFVVDKDAFALVRPQYRDGNGRLWEGLAVAEDRHVCWTTHPRYVRRQILEQLARRRQEVCHADR